MKNIIGIALLLVASLTLFGCGDKKPSDVALDFYRAVEKQDVDKAYSMLYLNDDDAKNEMQVKGKLQMIIGETSGKMKQHGGTKDIVVKNEKASTDNTMTLVTLEVTFKDKTVKNETFRLRQKNKEWKVVLG
ncbi:DUF4878 domain-containing protein [Buttiauxella selenatireducens]|uniref:DUF4878 domain-containing protein n=1 Tax=Buttiauxella selenatireducens TaxID=3073902 RepID=A0ABY9SEK4_9ENTR|nr:DUF4878 domain-containing protein [Buttiauxella sp. R73]WMY75932.1 DUF4878 domain-containing protein [Buttiauxella sp. R73]